MRTVLESQPLKAFLKPRSAEVRKGDPVRSLRLHARSKSQQKVIEDRASGALAEHIFDKEAPLQTVKNQVAKEPVAFSRDKAVQAVALFLETVAPIQKGCGLLTDNGKIGRASCRERLECE